jgi:hypothetical protein
MPVIWKGGPGHRAPYRTTHLRVPEPIKDQVQTLIDDYKKAALVNQPVTLTDDSDSISPNKIQAVIALLNESLKLPANTGGKIKVKIREALTILGEL